MPNKSNDDDLFADFSGIDQPLAARLRPQHIRHYYGQQHLLAEGSALRQSMLSGDIHSMILWGPPGTGKTTLAKILANHSKAQLETLSAVSAGIKDIRQVVDACRLRQSQGIKTILFIDEVHRFNKSQQDVLLPHIEEGLFIFIGATTENPSFELNNALLSRVRVYCLKSLTESDLISVLSRALEDEVGGLGVTDISIDDDSLSMIAVAANGDARIALGILERAFISAAAVQKSMIDPVLLSEAIGQQLSRFDNKGDHFYDLISALHKSVRGSATDASLYWFARMLEGGCDPLYIARRLVRMASEDIGNADPRALRVTLDAWDVQSRLGSPEGELAMAQAIIYLSVAPKSNASYLAFNDAKMLARQHTAESVPIKLRNAPTELMKSLDHGADYRYPHDYPHGYVPGETYLPDAIASSHLYKPSGHGFEAKIRQRLDQLSQLDLAFNEDKN